MKIVYLNVFLFSLFSCCSAKHNNIVTKKAENNTYAKLNEDAKYDVMYSSEYGGNDTFGYFVIEDKNGYEKELIKLNLSNEIPLLEDDFFAKNTVLFLYLGQKNTGGYAIGVDKLEILDNNKLIIYTKITHPKKGENVTMAITNPFSIIQIPKSKKYIVK
ncbi:protease complex subunit PrcB family protein [Flavobacterium sp. J27]|uniref:protease complex subunit PrcB family protein n=1 Tax=Flavobacterium sp. J27 TaxID=2060419 RepID=UPI0010320611|nr:protease complex subunit PrcB family protein [Flavobacterium sp. J27]